MAESLGVVADVICKNIILAVLIDHSFVHCSESQAHIYEHNGQALVLRLSSPCRASPHFNKETYVDFVAVQIKFLSFLAYIVRSYQVFFVPYPTI